MDDQRKLLEEKPSFLKSCKQIQKKRYFLILVGPSIFYIYLHQHAIIYNTLVIFFNALFIYWNFPILVTYNTNKPLYYDDLFINRKELPHFQIDDESKEVFKNYYTRILVFTNSLLTTGLYHYWLYKTQDSTSIYEIIGVTGGILKIFQMINHHSAITALYMIKRKLQQKIYLTERTSIEEEL